MALATVNIDKIIKVTSASSYVYTMQLPIHFDMRKFSFTNRIAPMWNSLPDSVVSANMIDTFKIRLDRFWFDQEIKYNWKADIHTRSRSQVDVILN